MKNVVKLAVFMVLLIAFGQLASAQTWTPLNNQPSFGPGAMLLLTDGRVLVHQEDTTYSNWWTLTPDINGSYVNGTWTKVASLPSGYAPLYFGSVVLPDGRVVVEGGEYNNGAPSWTNKGAIYNPQTNKWTSTNPPAGWTEIGDSPAVVLPNGTYLQSDCCNTPPKAALFNASTLTWTTTGTGKFDVYDEEGMTLLPNNKVLAVDAYVFQYNATGTNSELYDMTTGAWSSAGSTVVQLWDSCGGSGGASYEVGPAVLRPDGTVFATGANGCGAGHTAIYNVSKGTWAAGPNFTGTFDVADGPAALETNGNVLVFASPGVYGLNGAFFEWNGTTLTATVNPPGASGDSSYYGHLLELPTGQLLFTDFSSDVEVFTPSGTYQSSWQPTVTNFPSTIVRGKTYGIAGTQFNGLSQGGAYGDDFQDASNYPLVRVTNTATGHIFYAHTHNHTSMGVATRSKLVGTHFEMPTTAETGASTLEVVANGIPSNPVSVTIQ